MAAKQLCVLMTGAGAPGAAGIIKCLQEAGWIHLTVADASDEAVGRYLNPDFIQIPKADDADFIEQVLRICEENRIDILLPLVTRELNLLAQHEIHFKEKNIQVLVSEPKAIQIANDKAASYSFLKEQGIQVPTFFVVTTVEGFCKAALKLGYPSKPFCFKPSVSNGSRGVRIVSDRIDESDQLFNHKPYNLSITYTHALDILSSKPFPPLLVSEYLPGMEYSVDCLANQGVASLVLPRQRLKMNNGISVQGKFEQNHAIMDYCTHIIKAIGLHGNVGIQVKLREDGTPMLLEINPRVQGTIVAALGAGVNLPVLAIKQQLQLPITAEETNIKWGTGFIRYWSEAYY
jgi:carbamoyl-phosphate synthase large subunit